MSHKPIIKNLGAIRRNCNRQPKIIKSGFMDLDDILGGLRPGEISLFASLPGHDRIDLAFQIFENAVLVGGNAPEALIFSGRLSAEALVARINVRLMNDNDLLDQVLNSIWVIESQALSIPQIADFLRHYLSIRPVALVIVDGADFRYGTPPEFYRDDIRAAVFSRQLASVARDTGSHILVTQDLEHELDFDCPDPVHAQVSCIPTSEGLTHLGPGFKEAYDTIVITDHLPYLLRRLEPGHRDKEGEPLEKYHKRKSAWENAARLSNGRADILVVKNQSGLVGLVKFTYSDSRNLYKCIVNNEQGAQALHNIISNMIDDWHDE